MAQFGRLPVELVERILDYASKADLWRLSLVCKALTKFSSPRLYKDIIWRWSGNDWQRNPPIHILLRNILQRPELASQITHVEMSGNGPVTIWRRGDSPILTIEDLDILRGLVSKIGFPDQERCLRHLKEGSLSIFIALLLSRLHNLQYLSLGWKLYGHNDYLTSVLGRATLSAEALTFLSSFRFLKQVDFNLDEDEIPEVPRIMGLETSHTLPMLCMPSLESFRTVARERFLETLPHLFQMSYYSQTNWKLTTLVLDHSNIMPESLAELLTYTKSLISLSYEYWCDVGAEPARRYFRSDQLLPALENVKKTIQSLKISVRVLFYYLSGRGNYREYGLVGNLGSLRSFQALRNLEIPFGVLLGPSANDTTLSIGDVLPDGLCHLLLSDDGAASKAYKWSHREFLACSSEYLSQPRIATPDLSSFKLKVTIDRWSSPEIDAELQGLCDALGLDYSVQDSEKFYEGDWQLS